MFNTLKQKGYLKLEKTKQFYDEKLGTFLNGRQVVGRCPIQGCKSETAYADECSLGHQYNADELIAPKSVLSGETPVIKEVDNWYFDLVSFRKDIIKYTEYLKTLPNALIPSRLLTTSALTSSRARCLGLSAATEAENQLF